MRRRAKAPSTGSVEPPTASRPGRKARGLFGLVCLCLLGLAAFLGTGAPVAGAAGDECPNAAVRAQQGSTHLPDCRAWEMISQADKNGNPILGVSPISVDSTRVLYAVEGGVPGSAGGGRPLLLATRTADGWVSRDLMPPLDRHRISLVSALTDDLDDFIVTTQETLGAGGDPDVALSRLSAGGSLVPLHTFPTFFGVSGIPVAASDDLRHIFANSREAIDPSHLPGSGNIYDFGSGAPALVSRMPGTDAASSCGVWWEEFAWVDRGSVMASQHWASTEGDTVFFLSRGDDPDFPIDPDFPHCNDPLHLYRRDLALGETLRISGPPAGAAPDNGAERFLQAAGDGSWVVYRTRTSLTAADGTDGSDADLDVYRWELAAGNECLTCVGVPASIQARNAVSEDGSHVYFASLAQLTPDALPSGAGSIPNLYVWTEDGIEFVAPANNEVTALAPTQDPLLGGQVTPDGNVLLFRARRPELNAMTGSENGGLVQLYRYNHSDGTLTCASCPPAGPATAEVEDALVQNPVPAVPLGRSRAVSDDGKVVAFRTQTRLVDRDVNGDWDMYTWRDGSVGLITSGTFDYSVTGLAKPELTGISAKGDDILFLDYERLTPDAQDGYSKLYTARIDGGFFASPPPPSCAGDGCRGPLGAGPPDGAIQSGSFAGSPSPTARRSKARKCPRGKRRVKSRGKVRCVAKRKGKGTTKQGKRNSTRADG